MKDGAKKLGVALGLTAGAAVVIGLLYTLTKPSEEPQAKATDVPPPTPDPNAGSKPPVSSEHGWGFPLPPIPWPFPIIPQPLPPSKQKG